MSSERKSTRPQRDVKKPIEIKCVLELYKKRLKGERVYSRFANQKACLDHTEKN